MAGLIVYEELKLEKPRMILSFSGWMDGGDVSTGTVKYLRDKLKAKKIAEIDPEEFYVFNFPGAMEVSSLFRPQIKIENGALKEFHFPRNECFYAAKNNLLLFCGKEPNLKWKEYSGCIFELAKRFGVRKMYFVGSVAGPIPHTREPRISASVSREKLKEQLRDYGVRFTNYEGPGSIVTLLTKLAREEGIEMVNFVAEIPVYVQTRNAKCMEAIIKRLMKLLKIEINLDDLHKMSGELEKRIDRAVKEEPELGERVKQLEQIYDKESMDSEMKDVEVWLRKRGITL